MSSYCTILAWSTLNISKIFRVHRHWNCEMLGKVFRKLQVLSLEILGPKVVENFLLYRVVQALSFSLTSLINNLVLSAIQKSV